MSMRPLVLCLALGLLCQTRAQTPTSSTSTSAGEPEIVSHDTPAIFSSRVNLVSVPVVIRDREGHPVGGMRQEDFQLFDKGRAQVITKFTVEASVGSAAAAAPVSRSAVAPESPPPSRASAKPEFPERYVAYFFDDIHLVSGDLLQARQAANRHLNQAFDSNTRAGVFTTSGRATQDFSSDIAKLHAAVNRIQPWTSGTPDQQAGACPPISYYIADTTVNREHSINPSGINRSSALASAMFGITDDCLHHPEDKSLVVHTLWMGTQQALNYGTSETSTALITLQDLIRSMSALPGSRRIVMVSPGFIMGSDQRMYENNILDKAILAGVTINTLDIRGVYTPPGMQAENGGVQTSLALLEAKKEEAMQSGNVLGELADGTGGRFFQSDNGFEEGLHELAARPEYLYVLGFSPDNLKSDGSYHGLKVKLKEGAKLTIEARRGYWAPNHAVTPAEAAREDLEDALFSRDNFRDIPLTVHTEFFKQNAAKAELTIESHVDVKNLPFKKIEERNRDTVIVVTGLFDENGRYVRGVERKLDFQLRDQTLESARRSGFQVSESFELAPGRYIVRVVVRDSEGRSISAQNEGVEIP